jgi:hypothetical protein
MTKEEYVLTFSPFLHQVFEEDKFRRIVQCLFDDCFIYLLLHKIGLMFQYQLTVEGATVSAKSVAKSNYLTMLLQV